MNRIATTAYVRRERSEAPDPRHWPVPRGRWRWWNASRDRPGTGTADFKRSGRRRRFRDMAANPHCSTLSERRAPGAAWFREQFARVQRLRGSRRHSG